MIKHATIDELFNIRKGRKMNEVAIADDSSISKVRYLQIEDLRDANNLKYCEAKEDAIIVSSKDIVIAWDGANAGTSNFGLEGAIGSTLARLSPKKDGLFIPYVGRFLQFNEPYLRATCTGATIPHVHRQSLEDLVVPLPSLEMQKKIIITLDQAQELINKRKQQIELLDEFLQSVFLDMFGDPAVNPKEWATLTIRQISKVLSDGPFGSNLKTEHYCDSGVRVIRLQNIGVNEFLDGDGAYVSHEHYNTIKKHTCFPGDIIIGTMGDPNLRACRLPNSIDKAINKADCVQLRVDDRLATSEYICTLLNMPQTLIMASHLIRGQTRTRISMGRLAGLEIPVPPITIQDEFSCVYNRVKNEKDNLEVAVAKIQNLFNSLMQRAFKGKLFS